MSKIKESEVEEESEAPKKKIKLKEAEEEAEDEGAIGRLHKESEEEEEEDDLREPKEGVRYKKKPKKKEAEADAEEETEKGEMGGVNPAESSEQASSTGHTLTPGKMTGQGQHILVPSSQIGGERIGRGKTPSEVSYAGKSVETELNKSPLFVNLKGQLEEINKSVQDKLDAIEKSVNDRISNVQKTMDKVEKFYSQSMYKSVAEENSPESTVKKSIKEQIESGKARFVQ